MIGHRPRRNARGRKTRDARFSSEAGKSLAAPAGVRGMKLRTVSMLTLAFSLVCLAAFIIAWPPAPPQTPRPRFSSKSVSAEAATPGIPTRQTVRGEVRPL
jgi:hypothetical protein